MAQDRQTTITIVPLDAVKPEGNAGTTPFTFRILRAGDLSEADRVFWQVLPPDSSQPSLFSGEGWGRFTLDPGQASYDLTIEVIGDTLPEHDLDFLVALIPEAPVQAADVQYAAGRAINDDPFLTGYVDTATILEGGSAAFTIRRHGIDLAPLTVEYDLVPATWDSNTPPSADAADLAPGAMSGTIAFAQGATEATLTLVTAHDSVIEPVDLFSLVLRDPSTPIALPASPPTLRILDDDVDPATDVPASAATSASLAAGETVTGSIDAHGDHDWFRIALAGGAPYSFEITGISDPPGQPAPTPTLALRAADGTLLADGWGRMAFTAPADGIYYLDAAASGPYGEAHRDYALSANIPPLATAWLGLTITPIVGRALEGAEGQATTYSFLITRLHHTAPAMTIGYGVYLFDTPIDLAAVASIGTQPGAPLIQHGADASGQIDFAPGQTEQVLFVTLWGNDRPGPSHFFRVSASAPPDFAPFPAFAFAFADAMIVDDEPITGFDARSAATGTPIAIAPARYQGPMPGLEREFISPTEESLNIAVTGQGGWFIRAGAGDDAIATSRGYFVIDAGGGSNFIAGDTSRIHVQLDPRDATIPSWSTIDDFGYYDSVALMGISEATHQLIWQDDQGQPGHRGLTLQAFAADRPTTSITFPGLFAGQLETGAIAPSFHTQDGTGIPYLFIAGTDGLPHR